MKKILLIIIISYLIFSFSNCEYFTLMSQKEWAEMSGKEDDDVVIYNGGGYDIGAGLKPCYWKNGNYISLSNTVSGNSIFLKSDNEN